MKPEAGEAENIYQLKRKNLEEDFFKGRMDGLELAHNLSQITDELIHNLLSDLSLPEGVALLAVGGYGRRELMPFSDIDLWFLVSATKDEKVLSLLYRLWDMGFKVSYSVETPEETISDAMADITVMTTLINARFLAGDAELYQDFADMYQKVRQSSKAATFKEEKLAEQRKRHEDMGHARYLLEPNLKEGCGGLRDLNMLEWIGRFALNWPKDEPFPLSSGFAVSDAQRLQKAKIFLLTARAFLHFVAGRAEEIMSFAYQQKIAPLMGYAPHPGASAEDRLMKHYYLITREIRYLTASLLASMEKTVDMPDFSEPMEALKFLKNALEKGKVLPPAALKQISAMAGKAIRLRKNNEAVEILKAIITGENNPEYILRIINESGMLARILSEFLGINARPQRDIYHIYTVDEHSLKTLGFLNYFRHKDEKCPLFLRETAEEINDWQTLCLAAFFHDIGKNGFLGHAETGAQISMELAKTFALSETESEDLVWLVRNHLIMNNTAFHRDLSAKETIEDFAAKCGTVMRLNALLLLSAADLMAVAPNVWTGWKASLLEDLYRKTKLLLQGGALPALEDTAEILRQMKKLAEKEQKNFSIQITDMPDIAASKVVMYAKDAPGLAAKIVGAMALSGASIISARIVTAPEKEAVDVFLIQEIPGRYQREQKPKLFADADKIKKLKKNVENALNDRVNIAEEIKNIQADKKKAASVLEKRVLIDNKASVRYSVIDINCLDRRGFLYFIASKLTELNLNIVSAYITTYGNRVVDAFYVEEIGGGKINSEKRLEEVTAELYKVLDFD